MPHLVILVVDQIEHAPSLIEAWQAAGVSGLTIHESTGMGRALLYRDDLPLLPSLRTLFESDENTNRTFWAVVDDNFDLDGLFDATEAILGPLDAPNTGIMFTVPVGKVRGLHRHTRLTGRGR